MVPPAKFVLVGRVIAQVPAEHGAVTLMMIVFAALASSTMLVLPAVSTEAEMLNTAWPAALGLASNVVVPFAEKRYYELRPTLGIQAPGSANGQARGLQALRGPGVAGEHTAISRCRRIKDAAGIRAVGDRSRRPILCPLE